MEQAVPDATGHGQSRLFVVHAQTTAGCGYARYPRGRSVPPSKIQAATHQASLKRKIKNDSAHCWWRQQYSTANAGSRNSRQPVPTTGHHMKGYCHGDESQDDEDSRKEGWREEKARQGHEGLELEHEEVAGQESWREKI
jgi:hypothetical protein